MNQTYEVFAISDTHGSIKELMTSFNHPGDLFIHAGDFTRYGTEKDFIQFWQLLSHLPFRHKIVIAGNHQISLDSTNIQPQLKDMFLRDNPCSLSKEVIKHQLSKHCLYLEHQAAQIDGLRIFGSPFTPFWGGSAFQYDPRFQDSIWSVVPPQLDILITHGPPLGILDKEEGQPPAGSIGLRETVRKVQPTFHVFGHIHQGYGAIKIKNTTYVNVAVKGSRLVLTPRHRNSSM